MKTTVTTPVTPSLRLIGWKKGEVTYLKTQREDMLIQLCPDYSYPIINICMDPRFHWIEDGWEEIYSDSIIELVYEEVK
tara:strand:+ start:911 stop:1147 length:237 start_codon:yes stop_codon:yes gene_type:complete